MSTISVQERNYASGRPWDSVWLSASPTTLNAGDVISSSSLDGPGDYARAPTLAAGDDIEVVLRGDSNEIDATFRVPETGLSESEWLHPDGRQTSAPCAVAE